MNKLDNIAKAIAEGSSKVQLQEEEQVAQEKAFVETTQIDRVSEVEAEDQQAAEAGLVGGFRSVGAVAPEEPASRRSTSTEEELDKFCEQVQGSIELINTYEMKMGNSSRVTPEIIDDQQHRLYNAIMTILKTEKHSDFIGGMEFLFRKFRSDDRGAFDGSMLRRRINFMKQPSGDKAMLAYTGFLDLLSVFSEPRNRKVLWPRFNRRAMLVILSDQQHRQRLETYMNRISA